MRRILCFAVFFFATALCRIPAHAASALLPQPLAASVETLQEISPAKAAEAFLDIPYRNDGMVNDNGQYALFNKPDTPLKTPGLNCSGMTLALARIVLAKNIAAADATKDKKNDSGPGAPDGHDWDFGFDLVMNLGEGFSHSVLVPAGQTPPKYLTGKTAPAFSPHDQTFAADLLPRIRPDAIYFVSFSKSKTAHAPPYLHYHTAAIVRDGDAVWLYSTTRQSRKVTRFNLAAAVDLARFRASFKNVPGSYKRLLIVEALPATASR